MNVNNQYLEILEYLHLSYIEINDHPYSMDCGFFFMKLVFCVLTFL